MRTKAVEQLRYQLGYWSIRRENGEALIKIKGPTTASAHILAQRRDWGIDSYCKRSGNMLDRL